MNKYIKYILFVLVMAFIGAMADHFFKLDPIEIWTFVGTLDGIVLDRWVLLTP